MTDFQKGDAVITKASGMTGTVVSTAHVVGIKFECGEVALFDAGAIELTIPDGPRTFTVGQYVRFADDGEVGVVIADDGDDEDNLPYNVKALKTRFTNIYDAEELQLWNPRVGERVAIADDPDNGGTVLSNWGDSPQQTFLVQWDGYEHPQRWEATDLLPFVPSRPETKFKDADRVVYVRGPLAHGATAKVIAASNGGVYVAWHRAHWKYAGQPNGIYPADCFDHYDESAFSDAA
jgi:hypothetical protein